MTRFVALRGVVNGSGGSSFSVRGGAGVCDPERAGCGIAVPGDRRIDLTFWNREGVRKWRFIPCAVDVNVLPVEDFVKPLDCDDFGFVGVWTVESVGLDGLAECCLEALVGFISRDSLD